MLLISFPLFFLQIPNTTHEPIALVKGTDSIAYTITISWGDRNITPLLNQLKKDQLRTSFFISGIWAERNPDLIKEIYASGHEIGMLGYQHLDYVIIPENKFRRDIYQAESVFKKLEIPLIRYNRSPTADFHQHIKDWSKKVQYDFLHHSIDGRDSENRTKQDVLKTIKQIKKGDIILLDASNSSKSICEIVRKINAHAKKESIPIVKITDMLMHTNIQLDES